ncbi:MAG: nucleotidyltransferase substrate binding protein [Bdellovibrionota bacterium]
MSNSLRWKQRFENFERAYNVLCRLFNQYQKNKQDEAIQMALVQAFEFTYELSWHSMKDYLENEGFQDVKSPKQTVRTAFQARDL